MGNNRKPHPCNTFKNCAHNVKKKCCISASKYSEIKKTAKIMIAFGILAILVLCFPPVVWFVIMAIGMIVLGIKIFRI